MQYIHLALNCDNNAGMCDWDSSKSRMIKKNVNMGGIKLRTS